jgi:hypothetical protein
MTFYHLACHRQALRAAIAINNIGCTLLENGCYGQAHQTLRDAARAAVVLLGSDGGGSSAAAEARASVAATLAAADQRLAVPVRSSPQACQDAGGKAPAPLRIAIEESDEDPDLIVLSAIAVHNSALSCYYQARTETECPFEKRRRLLSKAKILLKSSYGLVADCPPSGSRATLSCALHILENLHLVARISSSSSAVPPCIACASPSCPEETTLDAAEGDHLLALEDELVRLRWTAMAVEQADVHFFGRPDSSAAAA